MKPMLCFNCGEILANKVLVYNKELKKVCETLQIDFNMISRGVADNNPKFKEESSRIINKLCKPDRYCCKFALSEGRDLTNLIKG